MVYEVGDKIITKKNHPCGTNEWTIIRTGADIKIKCSKCGRIVMIAYDEFGKRVKKHIPVKEQETDDRGS